MARKAVAAVRKIWTEDGAEFHGEFVDFDQIWSWPKPARSLPVLIGGVGVKVLRRVLFELEDHEDPADAVRQLDRLAEFVR
ncbi:hypothetical protein [Amycolatopsis sp. NPDC054798]